MVATIVTLGTMALVLRALILMGHDDADRACRYWALSVLLLGAWGVLA